MELIKSQRDPKKMKNIFLLSYIITQLVFGGTVSALTIYRIGGSALPPPQIEGEYEFVQLNWDELETSKQGSSELLELRASGTQGWRWVSRIPSSTFLRAPWTARSWETISMQ